MLVLWHQLLLGLTLLIWDYFCPIECLSWPGILRCILWYVPKPACIRYQVPPVVCLSFFWSIYLSVSRSVGRSVKKELGDLLGAHIGLSDLVFQKMNEWIAVSCQMNFRFPTWIYFRFFRKTENFISFVGFLYFFVLLTNKGTYIYFSQLIYCSWEK